MIRTPLRVVIVMTIACTLDLAPAVHAWTRRTPSVAPQPDGYLRCNVLATSKRPIAIVATILSGTRTDVTEFGYGSRERTPDGLFKAEETVGSFDNASGRYKCKIAVSGARHKNVAVRLMALDGDDGTAATAASR
jgi:hypothetical protein